MAEDVQALYDKLRKVLARSKAGLDVRTDTDAAYELYGKKKVTAYGKEFDGMYFVSAVRRKAYVVLYHFPAYSHPAHFAELEPPLAKCRKGKSCFHVKKADPELLDAIDRFVKQGKQVFKDAGWV